MTENTIKINPAFYHPIDEGKEFQGIWHESETTMQSDGKDEPNEYLRNGFFTSKVTTEILNNPAHWKAYMAKDRKQINALKIGETWVSPYHEHHKLTRTR